MGNLLSVPKQAGYQERLVDWDVDHVQPGAAKLQISQSQYSNFYQTHPYYSYHSPNVAFPQTVSNLAVHQSSNSSGLVIYPIDETTVDEDYLRPRTYWTKRQIPVIQEPNQMFLTIPSHSEPYPPYPLRNRVQRSSINPQYGYYTNDKTELIFPTRNRSEDSLDSLDDESKEEEEFFNEAIPFIDEDKSERNPVNETMDFNSKDCHHYSCVNCVKEIKNREKVSECLALKYIDISKNEDQCCHNHIGHCLKRKDETESQKKDRNETLEELKDIPTTDSNEIFDERQNEETVVISTPKMHTIMPELNLDLSGLNSDISSEDSNTEKCWKSPEEVRLGCGRVAALAKHFSKLGDAGIIKFKSMKLNGSRQFMSEPDIASPRSPEKYKNRKESQKEFKSESDLSKLNKSLATTPEKEWSMILLHIQASNEVNVISDVISKNESTFAEENKGKVSPIKDLKQESLNDKSKLSLNEQYEIIEQLKEFSNLDNADAPLFIPDEKLHCRKNSNSDKETMTDTNDSSSNSRINMEIPKYTIVGTMRLENFRKHSLPSILSTLNISPGFEMTNKINRLEKYWSLKDLMSEDLESNDIINDSAKYFIFPSCSRVVSAPEISNEDLNVFQFQSVNPEGGNLTIHSTISISEEDSKNEQSDSESESGKNRKVCFNIESKQRKFPSSFVRTRQVSKSHEELCKRKVGSNLSKRTICKSLEKLPDSNLSVKSKRLLVPMPERNSFIGTHAAIKSVLQNSFKSDYDSPEDERKKKLAIKNKAESDLDISERKPTPRFEKGDWIFREFPPLENLPETRKPADY